MWKVLIVGDDHTRATALRRGLQAQGYGVVSARDAGTAVRLSPEVDLVILALKPGTMSELEIAEVLRQIDRRAPVMVLTGRAGGLGTVEGVMVGEGAPATQPFNVLDIMAHVGAVLRETRADAEGVQQYDFGEVVVDFRRYTATRGGRPIDLSPREFEILRYLIERRGKVVTREQLLEAVWGSNGSSLTRTVDVHIAKLRRKIGDPSHRPKYILTVHRSGYKFIA